jgi:ketosteroid isomerase-like protein
MKKILSIFISMTLVLLPLTSSVSAANDAPPVIAEWQTFWNTYDLDQMDKLFKNNDALTYFSSEKEGLIRGFDAMLEHHKGFGFVPGGEKKPAKLWLEDIETDYVGDVAIVTAIWFFDTVRDGKKVIMRGPVSFVCAKDSAGKFKLQHVNFSDY